MFSRYSGGGGVMFRIGANLVILTLRILLIHLPIDLQLLRYYLLLTAVLMMRKVTGYPNHD